MDNDNADAPKAIPADTQVTKGVQKPLKNVQCQVAVLMQLKAALSSTWRPAGQADWAGGGCNCLTAPR